MKNCWKLGWLLVCLTFAGCQNANVPVKDEKGFSGQIIKRFTTKHIVDGKKTWELISDRAEIYGASDIIKLGKVKIDFYEDNKIVSQMKADKGYLNQKEEKIVTNGPIEIYGIKDKMKVFTSDAEYLNNPGKIVSSTPVRIEFPDKVMTGVGFEATPDFSRITILKNRTEVGRTVEE